MPCNVCNDPYHKIILQGQLDKIPIKQKFENCPECEARPRFKTFRLVYDRQVAPILSKRILPSALVFAGTEWEQATISQHCRNLVSASLYGKYGENTIKSDLRDLKEIRDNQNDYVHACNVLDYIFEIDDVLSSVYRVLKPGGIFLFHIAEDRLADNFDPPTIRGSKKEPYYPNDVVMPSVIFGKRDLLSRMRNHHFDARKFEITDIFSGHVCTWFLGGK